MGAAESDRGAIRPLYHAGSRGTGRHLGRACISTAAHQHHNQEQGSPSFQQTIVLSGHICSGSTLELSTLLSMIFSLGTIFPVELS